MARAAGEPDVLGILRHYLEIGQAPLPIGMREDNRLHQLLRVPAGGDELAREPVEQLGMLRPLRLAAEIFGGLDDSTSEASLPETVYRHTGQQRMPRIG